MQTAHELTFDRYRLDLIESRLWRGKRAIALTHKTVAVLRYLVEHAGQVVTKTELFEQLWPGTSVSDDALTFCIAELRKALGDNARQPKFIETVHRRGYRFLPAVTPTATVQSVTHKVQSSFPAPLQPETVNSKREPPVVGRDPDLVFLHRLLEKALSGERQIVFVTGEAGIGKTTVVDGFRQTLASTLRNVVGQCIEHYGPGEPYMPVLEALTRLCRSSDGKQVVTLLQHHAPTWLVQMPSLVSASELKALQRQTQGITRERMLREMGDAIDAITAEHPLILVLEDLHWSDASTVDLLSVLARRREPARLLVIGTYRPMDVIEQEHPVWTVKQELQLHHLCVEMRLGLLSEAQVADYLAQRFGPQKTRESQSSVLAHQLARTIHLRTDGNPLFMVTVVDDLVSQGALNLRSDESMRPEDVHRATLRIPDTVQQLLERQLERLNAADRRLLEVASVAGVDFSAAAVAAGTETNIEGVEERCAGLAQHQRFLRPSGTAEWPDGTVAARYSFLHALYQEVLYNRIPTGRQRRLHQHLGTRYEAAHGTRTREIAAELAVHFEQGRDYGKAVQYLQQAGETAVQRSAYVEAVRHLTNGIELLKMLPETPERTQQELGLQLTLGASLLVTKGYASLEVKQTYSRARELCRQVGDTPQLFPALGGLWQFHLNRAEFQTVCELGNQLLTLAQRLQDTALFVSAHDALGQAFYLLGEFAEAQTHLEQCVTLYDSSQHDSLTFLCAGEDPGAACMAFQAWLFWVLGYPTKALEKIDDALTLARKLAAPFDESFALAFAAGLYQFRREHQKAQERAEAVVTLASEQEFAVWKALGTIYWGSALVAEGQGEEGITRIRQGLIAWQTAGERVVQPYLLAVLAEAYGKTGQIEEGLTVLAEAVAVMNNTAERWYEAELYRLKGELLLAQTGSRLQAEGSRENTEEAEGCFQQAIDIARKQQAKSLELRAVVSLSRLWQQQDKTKQVRSLLAEVYSWFTEGFDTKDLQEAKALLDELGH